jgi:cephalosporin hydroxylase
MIIQVAKNVRQAALKPMYPVLTRRIARKGPIHDPRAMFDYMARGNLGVLSAIQSRDELVPVLEVIKAASPSNVLEIGTANGGTLFLLTRVAAPDATIVSLDLPGGDWGGGYSEKRIPLYEAFALPGQTLHLFREDSHKLQALERVKQAFAGRTIDFLFIDGDHSYEGVRSDFEMYGPMVTRGGYIGFHDIAYTDGVTRLWNEVKPSFAEAREFTAKSEPVFGIGLGKTRS